MRTEVKDRYYRVYTYQDVDRVPDIEFGYWPQTIRRWLKEGMPLEMTPEETTHMFSSRLDQFLGLEHEGAGIGARQFMNPWFEEKVIERKSASVIMRGGDGIIAERYMNDQDESSIPHFLEFPVKTPDDWQAMRQRYDPNDPARRPMQQEIDNLRQAVRDGKYVSVGGCGIYGQLRNWMGFENLSTAFYDYPEMIHDMVELWAEIFARTIEALPDDIPVDHVSWWEDMASRNGPFVGPKMFREFLQPGYHRVMAAARKRGAVIGIVDCDGNPHDIVANWMEEGVNIMFPLEVAAGCDAFAWRKEFGRELRLRGAIAKTPLARGRAAIDAELERIKPLLDQGGFIPHLDHLVPPDISYDNYRYYREKKMRLIGK
ncbi:MAG TPA: uroporphyrinogen decarboxylase family protein [Phycisphaerae bacterium]|nr:uroporphyrinogen decarboxylase family protein [Phycisphaerae bacterium]